MTPADFDKDAIDWDHSPAEPVVHWQQREAAAPPALVGVGAATLMVAALGAFALGLLLSERLNDRSPIRWR